jgi:hypothetical protein
MPPERDVAGDPLQRDTVDELEGFTRTVGGHHGIIDDRLASCRVVYEAGGEVHGWADHRVGTVRAAAERARHDLARGDADMNRQLPPQLLAEPQHRLVHVGGGL